MFIGHSSANAAGGRVYRPLVGQCGAVSSGAWHWSGMPAGDCGVDTATGGGVTKGGNWVIVGASSSTSVRWGLPKRWRRRLPPTICLRGDCRC
jgi:hypothetical protein